MVVHMSEDSFLLKLFKVGRNTLIQIFKVESTYLLSWQHLLLEVCLKIVEKGSLLFLCLLAFIFAGKSIHSMALELNFLGF